MDSRGHGGWDGSSGCVSHRTVPNRVSGQQGCGDGHSWGPRQALRAPTLRPCLSPWDTSQTASAHNLSRGPYQGLPTDASPGMRGVQALLAPHPQGSSPGLVPNLSPEAVSVSLYPHTAGPSARLWNTAAPAPAPRPAGRSLHRLAVTQAFLGAHGVQLGTGAFSASVSQFLNFSKMKVKPGVHLPFGRGGNRGTER